MKLVSKKPVLGLCIGISLGLISSTGFAKTNYSKSVIDQEINSAYDLLAFQDRMATQNDKTQEELVSQSLRLKTMANYAKTVAIRSGLRSRINNINEVIKANERNLDAIYDFQPLMIQDRVVPPVISEVTDLYNQPNATQINIAKKRYKIERQARFASTAVNWREYLQFPIETSAFEKFGYIAGDMKPQNKAELQVWHDATMEGWEMGVNQANNILKQALERLNRDFIGMVRFHQFVMQGKLSMPVIAQYKINDTNDGTTMVVDEDLLRITVLPTFNSEGNINHLPQHELDSNELMVIGEDAFVQTPEEIGPKADEMKANMPSNEIFKSKSSQPIAVAQQVQKVLNDNVDSGNPKSDLATNYSDNSYYYDKGDIGSSQDKKDTLSISIKRIPK